MKLVVSRITLMPSYFLGLAFIAGGVSLVVLCGISIRPALADANKCCVPAHADSSPPAPPAGANDPPNGCFYIQPPVDACFSGPNCGGSAYQNAIPGACSDSQEKNCSPNAAQTLVTVKNGTWSCPAFTCTCTWTANVPEQTGTVQVSNCTGDGC